MATVNEKMTAIADPIRSLTKETDPLTLDDMATDLNGCVEANADLESVLYGTDFGGKSYYDMFWDSYQTNGKRTNYRNAFAGLGWTDITFKPKYPLTLTDSCQLMFLYAHISNLAEYIRTNNIELDFSKSTNLADAFNSIETTVIPKIDCTGATVSLNNIFGFCSAHTIEEVVLKKENTWNTNAFNAYNLQYITITGEIGSNIEFQGCTRLKKVSILGKEATDEQIENGTNVIELNGIKYWGGIFGALSKNTTGKTIKLSLKAINTAFETSEGSADGSTSEEWIALKELAPNWTITLV